MNQEAIVIVQKCLDNQDPYLDLGKLGLRDEDFAEGTELDGLLRQCTHLQTLILSNTQWNWKKPNYGVLERSKNIGDDNLLNTFPSALVKLINLTRLLLGGFFDKRWGIRDMSPIKNLVKLKEVDLSYNKINKIIGLGALIDLERLAIQGNKIIEISGLGSLLNLKWLRLSNNMITEINGLERLTRLELLGLYDNQIIEIKGLERLSNLKFLWLGKNQIRHITGLVKLKNLENLSLIENQITEISGLNGLENLRNLGLEKNLIRETVGLEDCLLLSNLGLANNQITNIKPLLPLLKRSDNPLILSITNPEYYASNEDEEIKIYGNPLTTPPVSVVKKGNEAVLRYFEKIAKEGQDYIYEAKLILIGEGSAGKTSLQMRLQDAKAKLPRQDKRTRGIQIADWPFKTSKGRPHIAHIWDFGGQDVYYPVHRFFLTENAVFVLLASTRQTTHNFDYWIPTIFQFGGKSPIILGQTCHDGNKVAWNDLGYYMGSDNFNIIKTGALPYQELNLTNKNEGLDKIKKTIVEQLTSLPHYGKGVPKTWVTVRDKVAAMAPKTACIPFSQFKELCRAISKEGFTDAVAVDDCASFLHSIGVVLWYADIVGLKDWVVLQPEWAMNAVYKIIDDADIQNRRGIILAKDFKRLWSEGCYEDMHDVLKKMLEVFKIAFPKKHAKGDYIIPARLLSMPAEARWQIAEPCLRLEYKYEFMPRGMVNQLSAELSRYIIADEQVWNDAVNFKNNDASCQVTEDFYNRFIRIVATGKDARALVMLVMNGLQDITDGYRGVTPQIIVPCTCKKCEKSAKPITFEYDRLLEWSEEREHVTCNNSGETLRIDDLLYHVGLLDPEKKAKTRNMKKIFISYSKHDEEFKEEFHSHLVTLREQGLAYDFNCKQIDLGAEWDPTIQKEVDECDIMICLVSVHFLNTEYIRKYEVEKALAKGKQLIPIPIKPCDWENSNIGKLYAPLRGKYISLDQELLLRNIIKETTPIERAAWWVAIIKELREKVFKA